MKALVKAAVGVGAAAFALSAHADTPSPRTSNGPPRAKYVDLAEWLDEGGQRALGALTERLRVELDDVCGDTFCEGEYPDFAPVALTCAVEVERGELAGCTYVLAASAAEVDAQSGVIRTSNRFYTCPIPTVGTPAAFLARFAALGPGERAMTTVLTAGGGTIFDALAACVAPPSPR
jgi:hypothetical protein